MNGPFHRVFLLVLDSVGIGALPDAADFGDAGANTLGHIAELAGGGLQLPHLARLGLGNIAPLSGIPPASRPEAAWGMCAELAPGKDTTSGHWEMAGIRVRGAFPTFYDGFPGAFISRFVRDAGLPGVLGNVAASGTEILERLGAEHLASGKPIVYTSADSVFQIACHEEGFGLERLYRICETARKLCDELGVARVIARPFLGSAGGFRRTTNRRDFSVALPEETMMDRLQRMPGIETVSVGKVASIFSERGFHRKVKAGDNRAILSAFLHEAGAASRGLIFGNLVDFDQLYGHRRNISGYARELEWFDSELPRLLQALDERDLLILTADHGNDPSFRGTDHTREHVPLLAWSRATASRGGAELGLRRSFADVGQTVLEALGCPERQAIGDSFLARMMS